MPFSAGRHMGCTGVLVAAFGRSSLAVMSHADRERGVRKSSEYWVSTVWATSRVCRSRPANPEEILSSVAVRDEPVRFDTATLLTSPAHTERHIYLP
jgi:hypothetical protein